MRPQRLRMDQVVAGLRLAKPVTSSTGMTVLGAGSELSAVLIDRLRKMGVTAVYVEPDGVLDNVPAKTLEQLEEDLARRFRHAGEDPTLALIRGAVLRQLRAKRWEDASA